ncbi:transcription termination/antitermination NusG family protein [Rhizobium sp. WW_1]|jgi:transcriptional antiterminator NusG|uniref:transcription termination/antitermination protein NusG n=1 Tax=Rhizobium sp. WW_1 TaxID=1907375 RepID=UPI0006461542|nr:transcription termination/antitermination NusG family protein [Rhizobium sp. WW_1]RKD61542.1 transcriptional antiterminator NusG [Rhizobium sp. WW_1]
MMQLNGSPFAGLVSDKGIQQLDRIAREEANRVECIEAASQRTADLFPRDATWLVLQVQSGREQAVEKAMLDCGIEACAPMCLGPKRRRHHKELPPSEQVVFVCYVFVRCVPSAYALQALARFEHVRGVVGGWLHPYRVANETLSSFKELAASGVYDWETKVDAIPVGSKVRVKEGPFIDFAGEVVAFGGKGKGTPVVELELFGRKTPMLMPIAMLSRL